MLKEDDSQHFDKFEHLVSKPTTDKDRPSSQKARANQVAENMQVFEV
jgi:hypothetical protein